jgi:Flp pilus assembly protein TadB
VNSYIQFMDLFQGAIGVYLLFCVITGKGSIYKNDHVKAGMEVKYRKAIRIFCIAVGILSVVDAVLDYFNVQPFATLLFGASAILVVALFVVIARLTERKSTLR